jgi:hypothetical protein
MEEEDAINAESGGCPALRAREDRPQPAGPVLSRCIRCGRTGPRLLGALSLLEITSHLDFSLSPP